MSGDRPLTLAEKVSASRHRPVPDESLHPHPLMHHMPSPERLREQIEADSDGHDVEAGRTTPDWPGVHGPSSNPKPDGEYALSVFDAPTDPDIAAVRKALAYARGTDADPHQSAALAGSGLSALSRLEAQLSAPAVPVEDVARVIDPKSWADEDWRRELVKKRALTDGDHSPIKRNLTDSLTRARTIDAMYKGGR